MTAVLPPSCDRCFLHAGDLHSERPSFTLTCGHLLCISCIFPDDESCFICYQPLRIDLVNYIRDTTSRLRPRYHLQRTSSNRPPNPTHRPANPNLSRRADYSSYDLVTRLNSAIAQINNETSITTLLRIKRDADAFLRWQPRNQYKELEAKINLINCLIDQYDIVSSQESTIKSLLRTINAQIAHNQHADKQSHTDKHDTASPTRQEYSTSRPTNERLNGQTHTKREYQQRDRRTAAEDEYSPQTTNDVNVDSVSTTRNGQRIVSPLQNTRRSVTALSFPNYEDNEDYVSWNTRNQQTTTRHSNSEGLANAPLPRLSSLPLSDIEDPASISPSRMQDTNSARHASQDNYEQPGRRDQQIQAPDFGGRFDSATRPTLHIAIPKRPTFYALSIGDRYSTQPSPYENGDRPFDMRALPLRPKAAPESGEYNPRTMGNVGDRGNDSDFRHAPGDEWDENYGDDGTSHFHEAHGRIKRRIKPKGKARESSAPLNGLFHFDLEDGSSANSGPSGGRQAHTSSRPNLSRYSSFSSIGLLKTPDPKSGTIPVQLLSGPVYDSPVPFPLHPVPMHPPQSYDPVLSTFDSDYASDTHSEPQEVRLRESSMLEEHSPSDEQYYHYRSTESLENSPAREVSIDVKDNRRTPGGQSDRTLSTLHIPSPYSSPRPSEHPQQHRPERRLRSTFSKLNMSLLGTHDGYMSSEGSSSGWVSSATAVQASPRRRNPPADIVESPSSANSHHVHFSESTRAVSPRDEQDLLPIPPEPEARASPQDTYDDESNPSPPASTQAAEKGKSVAGSPVASPSSHSTASGSRRAVEAQARPAKPQAVTMNGEKTPRHAVIVTVSEDRRRESPVDQGKTQSLELSSSRPPVFTR